MLRKQETIALSAEVNLLINAQSVVSQFLILTLNFVNTAVNIIPVELQKQANEEV
jgi:hypothetical protein